MDFVRSFVVYLENNLLICYKVTFLYNYFSIRRLTGAFFRVAKQRIFVLRQISMKESFTISTKYNHLTQGS